MLISVVFDDFSELLFAECEKRSVTHHIL